jgi:hypothetical protein
LYSSDHLPEIRIRFYAFVSIHGKKVWRHMNHLVGLHVGIPESAESHWSTVVTNASKDLGIQEVAGSILATAFRK